MIAPGEQVDHCNARTEYEMISHPYEPETCGECQRIATIVEAAADPTKIFWGEGQAFTRRTESRLCAHGE